MELEILIPIELWLATLWEGVQNDKPIYYIIFRQCSKKTKDSQQNMIIFAIGTNQGHLISNITINPISIQFSGKFEITQ